MAIKRYRPYFSHSSKLFLFSFCIAQPLSTLTKVLNLMTIVARIVGDKRSSAQILVMESKTSKHREADNAGSTAIVAANETTVCGPRRDCLGLDSCNPDKSRAG